jgi:hypothetical protein
MSQAALASLDFTSTHPSAIALSAIRSYIPPSSSIAVLRPQIRVAMRAEIERLVEEIKQSVGLLRRHL